MPWQPSTPRPVLARASEALLAGPEHSNGAIALAAGVAAPTVARARRILEARGLIEPVPVRERARPPPPPQRPGARAAIEAGARTPRDVAGAAGVSKRAAWKMLRAPGAQWPTWQGRLPRSGGAGPASPGSPRSRPSPAEPR